MLSMAVSNGDYETSDFVCEEIQKYSYPEHICSQVELVIEKVNNMDTDGVDELIDSIKTNW